MSGESRPTASDQAAADEPAASTEPSWPLVPGDYVLGSATSAVAVCTLATQSLLPRLAGQPEIAIAGRVYTENIGIEKMVANLLSSPKLRVLVLCGRESRHRVGQAILSLHRNGADPATRRIRGATGPEPVVANLTDDEIRDFQNRFEVVDLIGETHPERILEAARLHDAREPVPWVPVQRGGELPPIIRAEAERPGEWRYDPAGFFLVRVDRERRLLLVEHYGQDRRLLHRLDGETAAAVGATVVRLGLLTDLSHAVYLGRELARAEAALQLDLEYQQDSRLKKLGA